MKTLATVSKNIRRIEIMEKLNGSILFGDDYDESDMLHAKGVESRYPHANIIEIHTEKAEKAEGVVCVLTAADIPGDKVMGEDVQDQYIFAEDKVRHRGDIVALVVADTYEHAADAAKLVEVDYEVLPAITDMHKAVGNEQVITERYPDNICSECHIHKGNLEQGFGEADIILEERYSTKYQEHAYIEPEVVIGIPGRLSDEVMVLGNMQNLYMPRLSISRCLNLPLSKVTIKACASGGSFGGKLESPESMAVRAALAALKTGRMVKYKLTREESIRESYKRHPFDFDVKIGADKEGNIKAISVDSVADGGAYVIMSPGIIFKAVSLGAGAYHIPNVYCHSVAVMTNNVPCGSCRGFGNPQGIFARECGIEELAARVGISPYQLRKKNILKTGDKNGSGQVMNFHTVGAGQVLDAVARSLDYERKYWKYREKNKGKSIRRGVGLSLSLRGNSIGTGLDDIGRVYLEVLEDGSVLLSIGFTEIGQGLHTTMAQIAAEVLGICVDRITINDSDSSKAPLTGACVASRGTFIGGNAIIDAGGKINSILKEAVAEYYQKKKENIHIENDEVWIGKEKITYERAVEICYSSGRTPAANGTYKVPKLEFNSQTGEGDPFYEYTYSCIGAEVEVDTCTGKTKVIKIAAAHDIGRAMNPKHARGQITGGAIMSMGYGIMEDLGERNGVTSHDNFDQYAIPTFADVGEIDAIIIENPDERGPFGARSLGEPALDPGAAAYVNAINHALGEEAKKIRSLPADLESVLFAAK
jgi:CO/xanthine dehydrogenase Mo-binding subunit